VNARQTPRKRDRRKRLFTTIACSGCGTCCSEPIVPVTDSDVRRIARATGRAPESFVRFYSDDDMDFAAESGVWIRFPAGVRAMGLRRRKNRCLFLDDDMRCTIYQHRPRTCRTFPYQADLDESGALRRVTMNPIVKCRRRRVDDSPLTKLVRDSRAEDREDDRYYARVEIWNESVGGKKRMRDFLAFVERPAGARGKKSKR